MGTEICKLFHVEQICFSLFYAKSRYYVIGSNENKLGSAVYALLVVWPEFKSQIFIAEGASIER